MIRIGFWGLLTIRIGFWGLLTNYKNKVWGVPYYNCSIMGPKTLF